MCTCLDTSLSYPDVGIWHPGFPGMFVCALKGEKNNPIFSISQHVFSLAQYPSPGCAGCLFSPVQFCQILISRQSEILKKRSKKSEFIFYRIYKDFSAV